MRQWNAASTSSPSVFQNLPDLDIPFVSHVIEVEYVLRMREMLRTDISSKNNVVDMSLYCLSRPFCSFCLTWEVDTEFLDVDFEVRQWLQACLLAAC